jgi:hypothetical protein
MTLSIEHLQGQKLSSLMAMYFRTVDGTVSKPTSVIIPTSRNGWLQLEADGCGKIRSSSDFFDRLFFDAAMGHTFIAPLVMAMHSNCDGSETIFELDLTENETLTKVSFTLSDDRSFNLRFEDDELYIDFA